jgi:hypothetical protein
MKIDASAVIKLDATKGSGLETITELSGSLMSFVGMRNQCQFVVNNTYRRSRTSSGTRRRCRTGPRVAVYRRESDPARPHLRELLRV